MNLTNKNAACLILFLVASIQLHAQARPMDLLSPNGEIKVSIQLADKIYYSITGGGQELLIKSHLGLVLKDGTLGENPELISAKKSSGDEIIKPYVALKFSTVKSHYNALLMNFKSNYRVEFRAFDDGIAYRFVTSKKGDIEVMNEDVVINFPDHYLLHLQENNGFNTVYEEPYQHVESAGWAPTDKMANLPVLIDTRKKYKILISESDLSDYPGLFLKGSGNNGAEGAFPKAPLEFAPDGDRSQKILRSANYIAKTSGTRNFPWRYFVIAKDDRQLIENTMTLKLAAKSEIADPGINIPT